MECFLTSEFDRKNIYGSKIKDETRNPESLCVYPVSSGIAGCFFLIDKVVPEELTLRIKYRYVPQWRFKFENKYAEYLSTLKNNMVNRQSYQAIGMGISFDLFPFKIVMDSVSRHLAALNEVHAELLAIQSIFPASILNSSDKAYLDYVALKKELEEEMAFQETNAYTGASVSKVDGICTSGGSNTIQNNTIRDLTTSSSSITVKGIQQTVTTAGTNQTVTGNTVYNLLNTHASASIVVLGIDFSCAISGNNCFRKLHT